MATRTLFSVKNYASYGQFVRQSSWWSGVQMGPPDAILGIADAFNRDQNTNKINLGAGTYRDDSGKPVVLSVIRKAEDKIRQKQMNKEYSGIHGTNEFCDLSIRLAMGDDCVPVNNKCNATVQAISGTGSLRVGAAFLQMHFPGIKTIYVPAPTWGNHHPLFKHSGLELKTYKYYEPSTCGLNFNGLVDDISKMPEKSIILLHAVAHNPTGVDPTHEQWKELSHLIKRKNLFPFFDMAYQGFASGDLVKDAFAVRQFVTDGHEIALAQSFAKNMGLYGERAGAFSIITDSKETSERVLSQLKIIIRAMYSNPPINGARLVTEVLSDPTLKEEWLKEIKVMSGRIQNMRKELRANIENEGSTKNWQHITDQIGMFCYTGLNEAQVERMIKDFSVFMTKDGRISVSGLTSKNVKYMAHAMHQVSK